MPRETTREATFLGDGLYAAWDGQQIALFTHDGYSVSNVVFLEPEVQIAFVQFMEGIPGGTTKRAVSLDIAMER